MFPFSIFLIKFDKQVNMTDLFNKWVVLGLRNPDPFNKHVRLVLTQIVRYSWVDTIWTWHANTNCHPYPKAFPNNSWVNSQLYISKEANSSNLSIYTTLTTSLLFRLNFKPATSWRSWYLTASQNRIVLSANNRWDLKPIIKTITSIEARYLFHALHPTQHFSQNLHHQDKQQRRERIPCLKPLLVKAYWRIVYKNWKPDRSNTRMDPTPPSLTKPYSL